MCDFCFFFHPILFSKRESSVSSPWKNTRKGILRRADGLSAHFNSIISVFAYNDMGGKERKEKKRKATGRYPLSWPVSVDSSPSLLGLFLTFLFNLVSSWFLGDVLIPPCFWSLIILKVTGGKRHASFFSFSLILVWRSCFEKASSKERIH